VAATFAAVEFVVAGGGDEHVAAAVAVEFVVAGAVVEIVV
jgi:hypothetical protein